MESNIFGLTTKTMHAGEDGDDIFLDCLWEHRSPFQPGARVLLPSIPAQGERTGVILAEWDGRKAWKMPFHKLVHVNGEDRPRWILTEILEICNDATNEAR